MCSNRFRDLLGSHGLPPGRATCLPGAPRGGFEARDAAASPDSPRRRPGRRVQAPLPRSPRARPPAPPSLEPRTPPTLPRSAPATEPRVSFCLRLGPRTRRSGRAVRLRSWELGRQPRTGLARRAPAVLRRAAACAGSRPHRRRVQ